MEKLYRHRIQCDVCWTKVNNTSSSIKAHEKTKSHQNCLKIKETELYALCKAFRELDAEDKCKLVEELAK